MHMSSLDSNRSSISFVSLHVYTYLYDLFINAVDLLLSGATSLEDHDDLQLFVDSETLEPTNAVMHNSTSSMINDECTLTNVGTSVKKKVSVIVKFMDTYMCIYCLDWRQCGNILALLICDTFLEITTLYLKKF